MEGFVACLHSWPHNRLSEEALPLLIHPLRPCAFAFSLGRMGKKRVPTDPQQMNLPIYEGFFISWNGYGGFFSVVFIRPSAAINTTFLCQCQGSQAFWCSMFRWIDRVWLLRYHNYHSRHLRWNRSLVCALGSNHFQPLFCFYLRDRAKREQRLKQKDP